jgi:hypothetical protein
MQALLNCAMPPKPPKQSVNSMTMFTGPTMICREVTDIPEKFEVANASRCWNGANRAY